MRGEGKIRLNGKPPGRAMPGAGGFLRFWNILDGPWASMAIVDNNYL